MNKYKKGDLTYDKTLKVYYLIENTDKLYRVVKINRVKRTNIDIPIHALDNDGDIMLITSSTIIEHYGGTPRREININPFPLKTSSIYCSCRRPDTVKCSTALYSRPDNDNTYMYCKTCKKENK